MLERPLLLPLLAIIAGVSAAASFSVYFPPLLAVPLFILAIPAIRLRARIPFWLLLSLLFMMWGNNSVEPYLRPQFPVNHVVHFAGDEPVIIEGVLDCRPQPWENGCRLQILAEKVCRRDGYFPVSGKMLLFVGEGMVSRATGDRVRFSSRLGRPRNNLLPGAYNYERHLAIQDIYVHGSVRKPEEVILMRQGVCRTLAGELDRIAAKAGSFIASGAPPVEATVLRALLLGEQGGVPPELTDSYARSGVSHILSISGFHVGIISLVVFQILYRLVSRLPFFLLHCNVRRLILLLTLPVMVFYLFLSGSAPATMRSVIMLGAFILALALERETDSIDSLLLAAVFILLLTPAALYDISFQLSFLALWGLMVLTPCFMKPFHNVENLLFRKILLFAMASAAATVATIIPVAHYFHQVSFTGLLANFLIVPLLGYGAVVLGFLSLPLIPIIPAMAEWLLLVAAFLVWLSNAFVAVFARIPVAAFLQPTWYALGLFFLFVILFTFIKERWTRAVCCSIPLILLGVSFGAFPGERDDLTVHFFSVGQGESTLVRFPNGKTMLIDGGGTPAWGKEGRKSRNIGERLLAPALWALGVNRIDYLVLTHPHPDHLQGLIYIARNFPVGEMWEGSADGETEEYLELKRNLAARGVSVRRPDSGDEPVRIGDAGVTFLWPPHERKAGPDHGESDINDHSLVFRLAFKSFSVLFTGDIGTAAENMLMERHEGLKCTVLKVPHHGSRHSSSREFLAATSPTDAVISAGYRNAFHLPAAQTLERLHQCGSRIWRTDEQGTITLATTGLGDWRIAPYTGQIH